MIIMMNTTKHIMNWPLRKILKDKGVGLDIFSYKYWDRKLLNKLLGNKRPINAGYKTSDIEITAFYMLSFIDSPGDHKSWPLEVTSTSMMGQDLLKSIKPPGRNLVSIQPN